MKVMAVCAHKGGVGKSTTAVQLSCELALRGRRVLGIDCDSQADYTAYTGGSAQPWEGLDGLLARPSGPLDPRSKLRRARPNLDVLGSSPKLRDVDMRIYEAVDDGPFLIRRMLGHVADDYDIVVVDVGHSTSIIKNVMAVVDLLVVPTPALFPDADHVGDMMQLAAAARSSLGLPKLDMLKRSVVSIWRRQPNGTADRIVIDLLRKTYGDLVAPAIVPNSGYVGHANKERLSIREYRDRYGQKRDRALHALVDAYSNLADFVLERLPQEVAAA